MCLSHASEIKLEKDLTVYKVLRVDYENLNNLVYMAPYYYFIYDVNKKYISTINVIENDEDDVVDDYHTIGKALHSFATLVDSQSLAKYLSIISTNSTMVIARGTIPKDAIIYKGFFEWSFYNKDTGKYEDYSSISYASDKLKIEEIYPAVYDDGVTYDTLEKFLES